jgi:competence ComEA-like helix-hairpin-helix protein
MKPSFYSSYFQFSKSQRIGIFIFLTAVLVFQVLYYYIDFEPKEKDSTVRENEWLAVQLSKDSLAKYSRKSKFELRPFNPNFITDFTGYKLGMTVPEIDRLLAYRKTNKFVNSAEEFQEVTQVSDSLLRCLSPYFKFPEWVSKKYYTKSKFYGAPKEKIKYVIDINEATAEDLKKIYGIGDGLSARILKEREKFKGFVSMEQLNHIWGLSTEVLVLLNESFEVKTAPVINRVKINKATINELMELPYIKYPIARNIVAYRSMNGPFKNFEDLTKISGFPVDRIKIIALYLEF